MGGTGSRLLTVAGEEGRTGSNSKVMVPLIGGSMCCRGEAVLWLSVTEFPVGTNKSLWKRGGLPGLFPEAL